MSLVHQRVGGRSDRPRRGLRPRNLALRVLSRPTSGGPWRTRACPTRATKQSMLRRLPSSVPAAPRMGASRPGAARQGRGGRARREARGISIRTRPSPRSCGGRGVARRRAGKRARARAHMRACVFFCCWSLHLVRAELSSPFPHGGVEEDQPRRVS